MRGWVCTSISFNFCTWYRVEIRFSDNPRQKETTDDIIWVSRNKRVIYRLGIIFSITHVVQLMVSKINLFCQRNTHRYPWKLKNGNGMADLILDTWLRYWKKLQFMLTEMHQISNLRSEDVSQEILSDLATASFITQSFFER